VSPITPRLPDVPVLRLPCAPAGWSSDAAPLDQPWSDVAMLAPFRRAQDGSLVRQATAARTCDDGNAFWVRFDCDDDRIIAPHTRRDDPLHEAEVVEVFLAAGSGQPTRYVELEVSPGGVLFDACIDNPPGRRETLVVDAGWDCPGVRWAVLREDDAGRWSAALRIPWASAAPSEAVQHRWRLNLLRIDRAEDPSADEYSCWSPTFTDPPDFHVPSRFSHLVRPASRRQG
jgi:hypothetical protein